MTGVIVGAATACPPTEHVMFPAYPAVVMATVPVVAEDFNATAKVAVAFAVKLSVVGVMLAIAVPFGGVQLNEYAPVAALDSVYGTLVIVAVPDGLVSVHDSDPVNAAPSFVAETDNVPVKFEPVVTLRE